MLEQNNVANVVLSPTINSAEGTFAWSWDCKGFDFAKAYILLGTHATNGTTIQSVIFSEHDTTTSATSQTDIAALSCAAATAATAATALPSVAVLGLGSVLEFAIDLRKRKRYMGLNITTGTTTMYLGGLIQLSKKAVGTDDTTSTKQVTDLASTATRGCALFVQG